VQSEDMMKAGCKGLGIPSGVSLRQHILLLCRQCLRNAIMGFVTFLASSM
jgi:ribosomal protein S14